MQLVQLLSLALTLSNYETLAFNIDLPTKIVHQYTSDSWFGFSISFYTPSATEAPWLLVGAPKDQSPIQRNIREGGRVYRCSTSSPTCQSIAAFEREGNRYVLNGSEMVESESKTGQWLGATVSSTKDGSGVLACAPRYNYYYMRDDRNGPTGYCYYATDNFENVEMIAPGRHDLQWGYHRLGYSMFGFSAAFSSRGDKIFMGGPGSWYYQGAASVHDTSKPADKKITEPSDQRHDYRYMGYSMATGDLNGDGVDDVAMGVPRDDQFRGSVSLFRHDLLSLHNVTGEQDGAYFGYALALTDLDGDGLQDLVVGAPFTLANHTEKGVTNLAYDIGAVHIYYQQEDHTFGRHLILNGLSAWSRFGMSLAAVGDLNQDGFNDLLVGAPYDGPEQRGAVYVFNGKATGEDIGEHSQVIYAEDIKSEMRSFGFSLTGGIDVDGNQYPDIAVGAYDTSNAVVLKTSPVVRIKGHVTMEDTSIDIEHRVCTMDNNDVACSFFDLCLTYEGVGAPDTLDVEVAITFDAHKGLLTSRAKGLASKMARYKEIYQMVNGAEKCRQFRYYVENDIRDKLTPIKVEANFTMTNIRSTRERLAPVLDASQPASVWAEVDIRKDCGLDGVCVPDLVLSVERNTEQLLIGSETRLVLSMKVENKADDSYESQLYIDIPAGMDYAGFKMKSLNEHRPFNSSLFNDGTGSCSFTSENEDRSQGSTFVCDIGNPLKRDAITELEFEFSPDNVDPKQEAIVFTMNVTSAKGSPESESTLGDNLVSMRIPIKIEATVKLFGKSTPESILYGKEDGHPEGFDYEWEEDLGPPVTHLYQVLNTGSAIKSVQLDIYYPTSSPSGEPLLYLLDKPVIQSSRSVNAKCKILQTNNVNPFSITVDSRDIRLLRTKREIEEGPGSEQTMRSSLHRIIEEVGSGARFVLDSSQTLNRANMDCTSMNCTQISCEIGQMPPQASVEVFIHARVFVNTLIKHSYYDSQISSVAVAQIEPLAKPQTYELPLVTTAVTTRINPSDRTVTQRGVPWWLILLAVLIGITILALLILLLWKCNFFKRNRPPTERAEMTGPARGDFYGFSGQSTAYAPPSMYNERQHGAML